MRIAVGKAGAIGPLVPDEAEPEVVVRGIVRERDGHCLVSLFLVNAQVSDGGRSVPRWLCQAHLDVSAADGSPVFVRRQIDAIGLAPAVDRVELAGLEMQYRASVELAVGHGVGVAGHRGRGGARSRHAAADGGHAGRGGPADRGAGPDDFEDASIREPFTAALPALDMQTLSEASDAELPGLLSPLADAYEAWIAEQEQRIADPDARLDGFEDTARDHLARGARASLRGSARASRRSASRMSPRRSGSPTGRCGSSASTRSPATCAGATRR